MASIYLSIYGINYSINYLEIEVKNYLNTYIEKNRYFINYSKNKQYLDLIYADLYNSQIKSIENDLNYNNFKNWNSFLELSNIKILSNSTNLYNTILNFIMLPTKFLKYNNPSIFENNDFLVNYSKNSFKKIKSYYNKNSIINKNYWYQ
ncbi:hypothetical protein [Spiroplasma endosymbiont of Atherix ibis]|uniref:hypothetical protein n=1 Tax=Spiroplasma endosymbiont of Atherix ibis TaxID=3066291 RepID=UPI0030D03DC8